MWLWRPVLADPPMCEFADLTDRLTLDHVADMHEALDLKAALNKRQADRDRQQARARR